jgi:hypothetical protein
VREDHGGAVIWHLLTAARLLVFVKLAVSPLAAPRTNASAVRYEQLCVVWVWATTTSRRARIIKQESRNKSSAALQYVSLCIASIAAAGAFNSTRASTAKWKFDAVLTCNAVTRNVR